MTVKKLKHSYVWYRNRSGEIDRRIGSPIDAETDFWIEDGKNTGHFMLRFETGEERGHKVEVYLGSQDFRKIFDLMTDADATVALREMSAIVAEAFQNNDDE